MTPVLLLTGPPGAGKSTVANGLVQRCARGVVIEGDQFFAAIRTGFIEPWLPESQSQNETVLRATAAAAITFARSGFEVIVEGIILPWAYEHFREVIEAAGGECVHVALVPTLESVLARGLPRPDKVVVTPAVYEQMHSQFTAAAFDTLIDTTTLTVEDTIERVWAAWRGDPPRTV